MLDTVIKVENLSKLYRLGELHKRTNSFRDRVSQMFKSFVHKCQPSAVSRQPSVSTDNSIWALKDVSFEVKQGDILGIIGRNGAGKSTLLKILSRITKPTKGKAWINGRIGSLLEVGTGFHHELTGRENIYLNGAILGMKKMEIDRTFDEIVNFAGVEKFIDTPVKRYSSGMYLRLAFAVAAHLEPEILLVDEVLAVGDAAFQKKCLGKMSDVAKEGRTVLFVSHNLGAVETLCNKCIFLKFGRISSIGMVREVISKYLSEIHSIKGNPLDNCSRSGIGSILITSFHIESPDGSRNYNIMSGNPVVFVIGFRSSDAKLSGVSPGISIHAENDMGLFLQYSYFSGTYFCDLPREGYFRCLIPELPLAPGNYLVGLRVVESRGEADWPKVRFPFTVSTGDFYGTSTIESELSSWGRFLVKGEWSVQ